MMTSGRPITDDELCEYIDGRLSEQRRAEIAAWLRHNPTKAAEVARLRELDDALKGLGGEVLEEPVPARLRAVLRSAPLASAAADASAKAADDALPRVSKGALSGRLQRSRFLEVAAVFIIFVLGGIVGWGAHGVLDRGPSELDWVLADASHAFSFYNGQNDFRVEFPPEASSDFDGFASKIFDRSVVPPDLAPAGYAYRGARIVPTGVRTSAFFFFEGARPEDNVTVAFWPADQSAEIDLSSGLFGEVATRHWVVDGLGFAVLGKRDNPRLDDIAREVFSFYSRSFHGTRADGVGLTDGKA